MQFDPSNLHRDQVLAAASALLLLVLLFAVKWYGPDAISPSVNGWDGLIHLRWLILVTIAASFMLAALGTIAPRSRLQLPYSVIFTLLALATLLWLGYRVLISIPPGEKPAAYVGLACALGIFLAGFATLLRGLSVRASGDAPQRT